MMKQIIIIFLIILIHGTLHATVFNVAKNGSSGYSVIQDAVDAAASGDTIIIGSGRYNEGQIVQTPGWEDFVRVLVHQEELTIIGSGAGATIIGPAEPYDFSQGENRGIVAGEYFGVRSIRVENLGFENMWCGFIAAAAPDSVFLSGCRFESNYLGVNSSGGNTTYVRNCVFENTILEGSTLLITTSENYVKVSGSDFFMAEESIRWQKGFHAEGCPRVVVQDCRFFGGNIGLGFYAGSINEYNQVSDCSFFGQFIYGVNVFGANSFIENCFFDDQKLAIHVEGMQSNLQIQNTAITNVSVVSLGITSAESIELTDSILAHGLEYTIQEFFDCDKSGADNLPVINLRNNDWGTDDAETIESWVHLCDFDYEYVPFVGQPVATESRPLGSLKSFYR